MSTTTPPTLHILVATIGRGGPHGVLRLLDSIEPQLHQGDALTVVYDARDDANTRPAAQGVAARLRSRGVLATIAWEAVNFGKYGFALRNAYAPRLTTGDFVLHADDDNAYKPGMLHAVRQSIQRDRAENPGAPDAVHLFKLDVHTHLFGVRMPPFKWPPLQLVKRHCIDTGSGAIPRALNASTPWEVSVSGDGAFYEALAAKGARFRFNDVALYDYSLRPPAWAGGAAE